MLGWLHVSRACAVVLCASVSLLVGSEESQEGSSSLSLALCSQLLSLALAMTSRQSILLGTDSPDGGPDSGGRLITPSAHVLAASGAGAAATPKRHSMATGTTDNSAGERFITPRTRAAAQDSFVSSSSSNAAAATAALFRGPSADDAALEGLMGSALASISARATGNAPRSLSRYAASGATAAAPSTSTVTFSIDSNLVAALTAATARRPQSAVMREMDELSAALAAVLENGPKGGALQERKDQDVADQLLRVEGAAEAAGRPPPTTTATAPPPAAATAAAGTKMTLCFDLVSSSAFKVPFSDIIAHSSASVSSGGAAGGGADDDGGAGGSGFAMDGYVAVEAIDWSRHHADTVFAKLTGVNRGADQLDDIALELAYEREQLQQQLEQAHNTIQQQKDTIQRLQQQLTEAQDQSGGSQRSASLASSAAAAASPPRSGATAAAAVDPSAIHLSEQPFSSGEEEEEEEDDIDQGMADEEDMHTNATSSSKPKAKPSTASFSTQT